MRALVLTLFLVSLVLMFAGHPLIGIGMFLLSAVGETRIPSCDEVSDE